MQDVSPELGYYAQTVGEWLAGQNLLGAEIMLILGGLLVAMIKETWPKIEDRPGQALDLVDRMNTLAPVLTGIILLHKIDPEELWGDLGRS